MENVDREDMSRYLKLHRHVESAQVQLQRAQAEAQAQLQLAQADYVEFKVEMESKYHIEFDDVLNFQTGSIQRGGTRNDNRETV